MKYCRYGMSLLGNLDFHYSQASPYVRKKLLGSIFTGKLVFENGKYRTTGLNEAMALTGLLQKDLENIKAERLTVSDKTFGNMRKGGLEPPGGMITSLPPQGSASASSATFAYRTLTCKLTSISFFDHLFSTRKTINTHFQTLLQNSCFSIIPKNGSPLLDNMPYFTQ